MKSLSLIALLSILVLTGCAYPAYHRGYAGYGGGYSTGYGVSSYSSGYPASAYYRHGTVPGYSYRYSAPHPGYGHGLQHYDWDSARDRHQADRRGRDSWRVERNLAGEHQRRDMGPQGRRGGDDREALWRSVPHANNYGPRRDGGHEHGDRREGGFGRRGRDGR